MQIKQGKTEEGPQLVNFFTFSILACSKIFRTNIIIIIIYMAHWFLVDRQFATSIIYVIINLYFCHKSLYFEYIISSILSVTDDDGSFVQWKG